MPFIKAFSRGSSKSKSEQAEPPKAQGAELRGMSFDEQQAQLSPGAAEARLKPSEHDRAENMKGAIDRSSEVFDKERKENTPYAESYLEKHYRHGRNKDLKAGLEAQHAPQEKAKGFFARRKQTAEVKKRVEAEYEKLREVSPDRARRMHNAELKKAIQDDARAEAQTLHPDDPKAQEAAYEKIWLRNYKLTREYVGGNTEKEKNVVEVEKEIIKENNKELKSTLKAQAGDDPIRQENAKKIYAATKQLTPEEEKERAAEKEKEKADAAEKQRKESNAALKGQIEEKHKDKGFFARRKATQKEYLAQKKLTAKAQEQKEHEESKAEAKQHNDELKAQAKSGTIDKKQAALLMKGVGEKNRKSKNAELKKNMSRQEYRQNKVHKGESGEEWKGDKTVKDVASGVVPVTQAAGVGNMAVAKGTKFLGGQGAQDTVIGQTHTTGGGQRFTTGGTTNEAAGIINSVGALTALAGGTNDLVNAIGLRGDPDPANRERGRQGIVDGTAKVAGSTVSTASSILQSIQAFSDNPALAAAMQLEAIPIVGIVGSVIKLVEASARLAEASRRASKIVGLREDAKANSDDAMSAALKGLRNADLQLVTSSTVDIIAASASLAGHGLTLGGITGPAGIALKGFASGISAVKSAGMLCYNSVQASKAKKAQVRFDQAKKSGAGDQEILKSGKIMITTNTKYAVQIMINAAREGDETALDYMRLFNLDTKDFTKMSDENLRKAILGAIQKDEEPETLLDKLKNIPNQVRGGKRSLRKKLGAGY